MEDLDVDGVVDWLIMEGFSAEVASAFSGKISFI